MNDSKDALAPPPDLVQLVTRLVAAQDFDACVDDVLACLGALASADRAYFFRTTPDRWDNTHEWCAPGVPAQRPALQDLSPGDFPWWRASLEARRLVHLEDVATLPEEALSERESLLDQGVRSLVVLPVVTAQGVLGFVGLDNVRDRGPFSDAAVSLLGVVAGALASLWARVDGERQRERLAERVWRVRHHDVLGRVARAAATDLRNRLSVMASTTEDVVARIDRVPDPTTLREPLDQVATSAWLARDLVDRLLLFADADTPRPEPFELNAAALEAQDLLRVLVDEQVSIRLALCDGSCPIVADRRALTEVVLELVDNAVRAMPTGGRITIATRPSGDHHVVLEVADEGPGIPRRYRQPASAEFVPGAGDDARGLGLGLAMVERFAREAGGSVELADGHEGGAVVRLRLPRAVGALAEEAVRRSTAAPRGDGPAPGRGERVLLVEDDATLRDTLARLLGAHGYEVVEASDALEALALSQGASVDLLVADIKLPVGSGTDLAQSLRRQRPGLPVLLISAHATDPRKTEVLGAGTRFLAKPFGRVELLAAVRQTLDARAAA